MKLIILFVLLKSFIPLVVLADQDWLTYRKSIIDTLTAIDFDGDTIWLGTNNGIGLYNTTTGVTKEYPWSDQLHKNSINDITIDHDGVGWIATDDGIWELNNNILKSLDTIEYINILAAEIDKNNIKWFITSDTVLRYDDSEWRIFTIENGLPVESLTALTIDNNNNLWIGTQKQGIISFDGNVWTLYNKLKPDVVDLDVDSNGRIWIGDYHGTVYSYDGKEWSSDQIISKQWFLYSLDVDKDGVLWAVSNKGIYRVDNSVITIYTEDDGLVSTFNKIVKVDDRDGYTVWVIGFGVRALTKFDGTIFKRVDINLSGPVENIVYSIAIDHNNVIWYGHKTKSITKYDSNIWSEIRYKNVDMLGENIAVDSSNNKWFSAEPGVVLSYDDLQFTAYSLKYRQNDEIPYCDMYATTIISYKLNNVLISATRVCESDIIRDFIYKYDGYNLLPYFRNTDYVFSLAVDSKNNLWISSRRLINIEYDDTYTSIVWPDSETIFFRRLYIDNTDILWVYYYKNLFCFDGESWIFYTTENSGLTSNDVRITIADHNNTKWIGTDAGVSRFDGETWTTFNTQNSGLCDNKVNAIAVEKNNTIWFGTDNGVSRYTGEVFTTGVKEEDKTPEALPVIQSYPNPFNPSTILEFTLPESGFTKLSIYNISGQKVRELAAEYLTAGMHSLIWNGRDDSGDVVSSGVYIIRLVAGKQVAACRMVLMK